MQDRAAGPASQGGAVLSPTAAVATLATLVLAGGVPEGAELGRLLVEAAERGDASAAARALELLPETPAERPTRARAWLALAPPDLGRARAELEAARREGVEDPEIAGRLGVIAAALGEDEEALRELELHARCASPLPDALVALGRVRERRGDGPGAVAAFRRAVELAPWSGDAWQELASSLEPASSEEALAAADRALRHDPSQRGARLARMRLLDDEELAARDAEVLQLLVASGAPGSPLDLETAAALARLEPGRLRWATATAEALLASGEAAAAAATLEAAPVAEATPLERVRAALLAQRCGRPQLALRLADCCREGTARAGASRARGAALLELGRAAEAEPELREAAALAPWRADLRVAHAQALLRTGRGDEAVAQLEAARRLDPGQAEALLLLGTLHRARGERERALAVLRELAELEPGSVAAHDQLGLVLHELGDTEQAVAHLRLAVERAPQLRRVRYNLAGVLLAGGRAEEAIPHLVAACDESLGSPAPPANAARLLAEARRRSGR